MKNSSATVVSLLVLLLVSARLMAQPSRTAQADISDDGTPLFGYDAVVLYGGLNASLQTVESELVPGNFGKGLQVGNPIGTAGSVGFGYVRLLPNLFITTPSSALEQEDPARLYRKITTATLRFIYNRFRGTSAEETFVRDGSGSSAGSIVHHRLRTDVTIVAIEPEFSFDLLAMRNLVIPYVSLGASFGHILNTEMYSEFTTGSSSAPETVSSGASVRWFYAALLIGTGLRINLHESTGVSTAFVPEIDFIIPLTSLAVESMWLPFGVRLGIGIQFPI